jgi:hypothetical protein
MEMRLRDCTTRLPTLETETENNNGDYGKFDDCPGSTGTLGKHGYWEAVSVMV